MIFENLKIFLGERENIIFKLINIKQNGNDFYIHIYKMYTVFMHKSPVSKNNLFVL